MTEKHIHRIELGMAGPLHTVPRDDIEAPVGVQLTVTPDLLETVKDVQRYLVKKDMHTLPIEGQPDAWLPVGIDVQLRLDQVDMVVSRSSFWFRAHSKCLGRTFNSSAADVSFIEAELARQRIRSRALAEA